MTVSDLSLRLQAARVCGKEILKRAAVDGHSEIMQLAILQLRHLDSIEQPPELQDRPGNVVPLRSRPDATRGSP